MVHAVDLSDGILEGVESPDMKDGCEGLLLDDLWRLFATQRLPTPFDDGWADEVTF